MSRLLALTLAGSAMGLALTLLRRLARRRLPSGFFYWAWLMVLLRLVLPLPGLIPARETRTWEAPQLEQTQAPETRRSFRYGTDELWFASGGEETAEAVSDDRTENDGPAEESGNEPRPGLREKLPALYARLQALVGSAALWRTVWLAGAAAAMARTVIAYRRFRRVLMRTLKTTDGGTARVYAGFALKRKPKLLCSPYVKTPMLMGITRPIILLPDIKLPPEKAENVLRHELAHYRHGDLYYKWFAALVLALHWFNPLTLLFRRELDRVCELSCDERVLRDMDTKQKQSYGETLLDLAAGRALPVGVVGTTFATEKRDLKERLEQIMKYKHRSKAALALTLAMLLLLGGCAAALAPAAQAETGSAGISAVKLSAGASDELLPAPVSGEQPERGVVEVSTVDGLLDAIGPNVTVALTPGVYDLSTAEGYGRADAGGQYWYWEEVHDGFQLVITGVKDFAITAASPADTTIAAVPRYANVLAFRDCEDVSLTGFTAGHTQEPGLCLGGVILLEGCDRMRIDGCALYGCGILGVKATDCRSIYVTGTDIYECSEGGAWLYSCYDVLFSDCEFRDCGNKTDFPVMTILGCDNSYGAALVNCHIHDNHVVTLVESSYSKEVYLLGVLTEGNTAGEYGQTAAISTEGEPVTVAGCEFRDGGPILAPSSAAVDTDGNELTETELSAMKRERMTFPGFAAMELAEVERTLTPEGVWEAHVSTVDELLAAIAPNTVIFLAAGTYDLTEASGYGAYGGQYYYWRSDFDGPGLVISGVEGLTIVGEGKDDVSVVTLPRYADVLRFEDCADITVRGLTAGHTLGAGSCVGDVLSFYACEVAEVADCGLFGCGVIGIRAQYSSGLTVIGNEIYQCSGGAVSLGGCADAVFADNDIHDCAYPTYSVWECENVTVDGETLFESSISIPEAGPYRAAYQR